MRTANSGVFPDSCSATSSLLSLESFFPPINHPPVKSHCTMPLHVCPALLYTIGILLSRFNVVLLEPGHPQGDAPPRHESVPECIVIWEGHPTPCSSIHPTNFVLASLRMDERRLAGALARYTVHLCVLLRQDI